MNAFWRGAISSDGKKASSSKIISIFAALAVASIVHISILMKIEVTATVGGLCVALLAYALSNRRNSRMTFEALGIKLVQDADKGGGDVDPCDRPVE